MIRDFIMEKIGTCSLLLLLGLCAHYGFHQDVPVWGYVVLYYIISKK